MEKLFSLSPNTENNNPLLLEKKHIKASNSSGKESEISKQVLKNHAILKNIAKILLANKRYLGKRLLLNIAKTKKWQGKIENNKKQLPAFFEEVLEGEIYPLLYYLSEYLERGEISYRNIYIGERYHQLNDLSMLPEENVEQAQKVLKNDKNAYIKFLSNKIPLTQIQCFEEIIDEISKLTTDSRRTNVKVLFIGDCLYDDIIDFLVPESYIDRISISYTAISSRNLEEIKRTLVESRDKNFDIVYFSPFTYEFLRKYDFILDARNTFIDKKNFEKITSDIIEEASLIIDMLVENFDCLIFVHNCCGIHRLEKNNPLIAMCSAAVTSSRISKVKKIINKWIEAYVDKKNKETFDHIFIIDENSFLEKYGSKLTEYIYYKPIKGKILHTAFFGKVLSQLYRDLIFVYVNLIKKKVVVCDLDNTLWKGISGEDEVLPFKDRQMILRNLKEKGVLLTVCSKNNEESISWENSTLSKSDFVALQINWNAKADNINSIQQEVNIKSKDFIFLDDLAIERDMVKSIYPEICILDSEDDRTWHLLGLWSLLLGDESGRDRTVFYKEEKIRKKVIDHVAADKHDLTGSFIGLGIKVNVRSAKKPDLKRVMELINRTNQFNLCGSRVSFNELTSWHNSSNFKIIMAEARDKFGDMGVICVAIVEMNPDSITIPVFVLSCRVIGYKMETAVINYINQIALKSSSDKEIPIIGFYKTTTHNKPCQTMYQDNGFVLQEDGTWRLFKASPALPSWLAVAMEI